MYLRNDRSSRWPWSLAVARDEYQCSVTVPQTTERVLSTRTDIANKFGKSACCTLQDLQVVVVIDNARRGGPARKRSWDWVLTSLVVGFALWLGVPLMTVMAIIVTGVIGGGSRCLRGYWGWDHHCCLSSRVVATVIVVKVIGVGGSGWRRQRGLCKIRWGGGLPPVLVVDRAGTGSVGASSRQCCQC